MSEPEAKRARVETTCGVCLAGVDTGNVVDVCGGGHVLCTGCALRWIQAGDTRGKPAACPLCRAPIRDTVRGVCEALNPDLTRYHAVSLTRRLTAAEITEWRDTIDAIAESPVEARALADTHWGMMLRRVIPQRCLVPSCPECVADPDAVDALLVVPGANLNVAIPDEVYQTRREADGTQVTTTELSMVMHKTPLTLAILRRDERTLVKLIEAGADVNYLCRDAPPLAYAVGHYGCAVRVLLQHGADAKWVSKQKDTLLRLAVVMCDTDSVKALLEHGALQHFWNPYLSHNNGEELLALAIQSERMDICELLVDHDVDINATLNKGTTCFEIALGKSGDVARWVIEHGLDLGARDEYGRTPFQVCAEHRPSLLRAMAVKGADVNAADILGCTALHAICDMQTMTVRDLMHLLELNPNPNARNNDGASPLEVALLAKKHDFFKPLLRAGAHLGSGRSLTHCVLATALVRRDAEAIEAFLAAGVDPNTRYGNTRGTMLHMMGMLHEWAHANPSTFLSVFYALKRAGADLGARDAHGDTLLHMACV